MRQRHAARVDENQEAIVKALRKVGASVEVIGQPVDLLVGFRGGTFVLEVKDGRKAPSARVLTPTQERFFRTWRGGPAVKVESVGEALAAIGVTNG